MSTEPDEADRLLRQTEILRDGEGNFEADENRARSIVSNDDEEQRRAVPMFAGQAKSVLAFFCYSWAIEVRCVHRRAVSTQTDLLHARTGLRHHLSVPLLASVKYRRKSALRSLQLTISYLLFIVPRNACNTQRSHSSSTRAKPAPSQRM